MSARQEWGATAFFTSWEIDGETVETVSDFIFWGSKITADGDCSHEIKRRLCDPIDSSPPGSPVPGILQARTLEWVAISFSNAWKKQESSRKTSISVLLTMPKPLTVWITINCGKF